MPPVARANPVQPYSESERQLLAAVDARGWTVAELSRRAAQKTRKDKATEKSAFYRIVRAGLWTREAKKRRRLYAELLKVPDAPWLIEPERAALTRGDVGLLRNSIERLIAELVDLADRLPPPQEPPATASEP